MKQIWTMLRLDGRLILRDKVAAYIFLAPVVMAFLILLVIRSVQNETPALAVDAGVPANLKQRLTAIADITEYPDTESLHKRINQFDNLAGVSWANHEIQLLLQGNEGRDYRNYIGSLISTALQDEAPAAKVTEKAPDNRYLITVITAVLLSAPVCIGGILSGFNLVAEKETKMVKAYLISPLSYYKYIFSRFLLALLAGYMNLICITFVLGVQGNLPLILAVTLFAVPVFALSPLIIGTLAKDKMGSISLVKVIMMIFLVIPIAAAYTPDQYQFCYYPFPMYWHYRLMLGAGAGQVDWPAAVLTLASGSVVVVLFFATLGRKLQRSMGELS